MRSIRKKQTSTLGARDSSQMDRSGSSLGRSVAAWTWAVALELRFCEDQTGQASPFEMTLNHRPGLLSVSVRPATWKGALYSRKSTGLSPSRASNVAL